LSTRIAVSLERTNQLSTKPITVKENYMLDNQLTMVYFEEALQKAAQSRAEHKAKAERTRKNLPVIVFVLATLSVVVWLTLMVIVG
jgi:hypothetical protein